MLNFNHIIHQKYLFVNIFENKNGRNFFRPKKLAIFYSLYMKISILTSLALSIIFFMLIIPNSLHSNRNFFSFFFMPIDYLYFSSLNFAIACDCIKSVYASIALLYFSTAFSTSPLGEPRFIAATTA